MNNKINIGVSACLMGDEVRYNGQACEEKFLTRDLSEYFNFVKVCPEVGIGLGIPRETIRLVRKDGEEFLMNRDGTKDHTDKMKAFSIAKIKRNSQKKTFRVLFSRSPLPLVAHSELRSTMSRSNSSSKQSRNVCRYVYEAVPLGYR